jgi:hypothetical protein
MIGDNISASEQILNFAKYLISHPEKAVKPAAANSYISAVGKRLLESHVSILFLYEAAISLIFKLLPLIHVRSFLLCVTSGHQN